MKSYVDNFPYLANNIRLASLYLLSLENGHVLYVQDLGMFIYKGNRVSYYDIGFENTKTLSDNKIHYLLSDKTKNAQLNLVSQYSLPYNRRHLYINDEYATLMSNTIEYDYDPETESIRVYYNEYKILKRILNDNINKRDYKLYQIADNDYMVCIYIEDKLFCTRAIEVKNEYQYFYLHDDDKCEELDLLCYRYKQFKYDCYKLAIEKYNFYQQG